MTISAMLSVSLLYPIDRTIARLIPRVLMAIIPIRAIYHFLFWMGVMSFILIPFLMRYGLESLQVNDAKPIL